MSAEGDPLQQLASVARDRQQPSRFFGAFADGFLTIQGRSIPLDKVAAVELTYVDPPTSRLTVVVVSLIILAIIVVFAFLAPNSEGRICILGTLLPCLIVGSAIILIKLGGRRYAVSVTNNAGQRELLTFPSQFAASAFYHEIRRAISAVRPSNQFFIDARSVHHYQSPDDV